MSSKEDINSFSGDYRFLSNYYPCKVKLDGKVYNSTEHAFQAAKTLDLEQRKQFYKHPLPTAGQAKKLGRKVKLRKDWESIKLSVMEDLLRQKFQDQFLKEKLLETGDRKLIEFNDWNDKFFGVTKTGGLNHLGKLLMKIRNEII